MMMIKNSLNNASPEKKEPEPENKNANKKCG